MNRIAIAVAAFVLWSGAMFGAGWAWRGDRADASDATLRAAGASAVVDQVNQTRATEQSKALQLADIGAKHEEDRIAAATVPAALVADLRAGRLQLRDDLATCNTARLTYALGAKPMRIIGVGGIFPNGGMEEDRFPDFTGKTVAGVICAPATSTFQNSFTVMGIGNGQGINGKHGLFGNAITIPKIGPGGSPNQAVVGIVMAVDVTNY